MTGTRDRYPVQARSVGLAARKMDVVPAPGCGRPAMVRHGGGGIDHVGSDLPEGRIDDGSVDGSACSAVGHAELPGLPVVPDGSGRVTLRPLTGRSGSIEDVVGPSSLGRGGGKDQGPAAAGSEPVRRGWISLHGNLQEEDKYTGTVERSTFTGTGPTPSKVAFPNPHCEAL